MRARACIEKCSQQAARTSRSARQPDPGNRYQVGLSWLTGLPTRNTDEAIRAARSLKVVEVIATSIVKSVHELSTLRITSIQVETIISQMEAKVANGTGDLLSGLYLAGLLSGAPQSAFADAMHHLQQAIARSKGTAVLDVAALSN